MKDKQKNVQTMTTILKSAMNRIWGTAQATDIIFDPNVLTLVFDKLIRLAYSEKGCEYAFQCIRDCYDVCPKWGRVITKQLIQHVTFPKEIRETNAVKNSIHKGKYKLKNIWPGHKRIEVSLNFSMDFEFTLMAGQPKICPTFEFPIQPKCYPPRNLNWGWGSKSEPEWTFCPWCCIIHFNRKKKHHSKRCIAYKAWCPK